MNKILFFDIDGTLGHRGKIIDSNIKALKELKDKGYLTFICTGRAPFYAEKLFGDLVSGIISCNGRFIMYQGKMLYGKAFNEEELLDIKKRLDDNDFGAMFVGSNLASSYHLDDSEVEFLVKEYGKEHVGDIEEVYTLDIFYHDDFKKLESCFKDMLVLNDHHNGNCDCSTIGFDKGDAIKYLLNHFNISKDNAYAFGDGYNDQAMFREVNHRIAMKNGVDVLKAQATYVSDYFDQDGVLKALKHERLL